MFRSRILVSVFCTFVLAASCDAQELLKSSDEFVKYQLSNVRTGTSQVGRRQVLIDYKRTKLGIGARNVQLAIRTDAGRLGVMGLPRFDEEGTLALEDQFPRFLSSFGKSSGQGMEFFLVVGTSYSSYLSATRRNQSREFLVSNVLRHGNMSSSVSARALTANEKAAIKKAIKEALPPETVPAGYTRSTASTKLLLGMPVKVGQRAKWRDAEVVGFPKPENVKVRIGDAKYLTTVLRSDWICVDDKVMNQAQDNPRQFNTDVRSLPDGRLILADGVIPLDHKLELPKGTPLLAENFTKWSDVYFLSSNDEKLQVIRNEYDSSKIEQIEKEKFAIREQTLIDMKRESTRKAYASNAEAYQKSLNGLSGATGNVGSLSGTTSGRASFTAADKSRETTSSYAMRTWRDKTGKFEILARLKNKTDQQVVIEKENGKSATVPISKLSDADVAYLDSLKDESDNPFSSLAENDNTSSSNANQPVSFDRGIDYQQPLKPIATLGGENWSAKSLVISPDNSTLVVGQSGAEVTLCDVAASRVIRKSGRMDHMGSITAAKYSPDGTTLVIGGSEGAVEVYSIDQNGSLNLLNQFSPHTRSVLSIAFSADSQHVLSGGEDKQACYWEVTTGKKLATISSFDGYVTSTCIRPKDNMLVATDGKNLIFYDVSKNKTVRNQTVGRSAIGRLTAIARNGLVLAIGSYGDIQFWNLADMLQMPSVKTDSGAQAMVFSPDSRHLITGNREGVSIWDTKKQTHVVSSRSGRGGLVQAVGVSDDGSLIVYQSGFRDMTVLQAGRK